MVAPKVEDCLKSIYSLQDEDTPVAPSAIAAEVGVQPPTITAMLQQMADGDLVHYERYQGARLTERGEKHALKVIRKHRLLELFLTEHLGYDWSEVHDEADVLEHFITGKLEARIAELLGFPTADPHGEPIPTTGLEIRRDESAQSLAQCQQGDVVAVSEVRDTNSDVLTYLGDTGVIPGAILKVIEIAPIGMVTVEVRSTDGRLSFPTDTAANIFVSRLDDPTVSKSEQLNEVT